MTRAELELALRHQQAENAALRAERARAQPAPAPDAAPPASPLLPDQAQQLLLMQELYTAVIMADADQRTTWVSKGFTALCGLELEEVRGRYPGDYLRPRLDDAPTLAYIRDSLRARVAFQYEVSNPWAQAAGGWIRVKVLPLYNEQREVVAMAGLLEDITEWKNSQTSLAAGEHRFRALAENVPGVLYEWRGNYDGTSYFSFVTPKVYELFGLQTNNLDQVLDYVHPDDAPAMLASIGQAVATQSPWFFEGRVTVPGQPLRWLRGSSVVTGTDATGVDFSGILFDITPLKEAETALRKNDVRRQLALIGFGDGTWEHHVRTNVMYYSKEYRTMLGYSDEEFEEVAGAWENTVHPDDHAAILPQYLAYLRGEVAYSPCEMRLKCRDGSYKWVLSRYVVAERAATGEPLIISGSNTDISELKAAQDALEASSRRLSTVIANFQDGLVMEDEARHIVLTNEAFCRMLNTPLPPAQLAKKDGAWLTRQTQVYVKEPAQYLARIAALLEAKIPVRGDLIEVLDGRVLQRDFTPVYDRGHYIGQLWKFQDVTVRAQAEEDLKRREEKYRGIIENMSLGLVEAGLDDQLHYANQSFCDMTGFCNEELTGQRLSPLLLSGDDLELVESKLAVRQQGIADSYEIVITTKTGQQKWLLVSGAPLYDDNQRLVGSIGIYLDVTPQKRLEASLREAKALAEISTRAKQDFLANMSHEIRTPMNAILGMSHLLGQTALSGQQTSYLHAISASAENLLVIINDILDLSKIEAGRIALERIGFVPGLLCAQVEKTLQYKAEEKGLSFFTHLDPAVPAVLLGDPHRITQILLNLAGNAVKFTERGSVRVACSLLTAPAPGEAEALVEFTVQDTGVGIDAEYLAQVFDDFSQEDSSVTRQFGGTGLGLGISKKLVEMLGGQLQIDSLKNHGTTSRFALRLPIGTLQDMPAKEAPDVRGLQQALRGKRILLVEDNTFNRLLASVFLSNADMQVTEAENGRIAVALAQREHFDLILMDVQMPVMNGYEATAVLRQHLGLTVPIIALTANAIKGERGKCLAAGMNDYLTKPFQEASLVKMVYDWIIGEGAN